MEILAILFFWVGNLADWYTTKRGAIDSKTGRELNPLMRMLINKLGARASVGLLVAKIAVGVMLHLLGVGALTFWLAGGLFTAAAISNKYNLLGKLIARIKE